ncbi:UDP-N-acetylmuramoylalanine--D-glutamate ligase [Hathewaya proteolytica DSM 3090]|uniref:UDP-N-acetylmuramoylalanine--D-glutamate ligase n=1 Tax=Hathewaya proteolytica DSM 3090 TaxID=1121331 RepID=A0A1M6M8D5_9CLOT|nr:UDP-N-acetylmuramoyl-L-alanine--D-glutamate ligase [Hathewaya proteolytica]SHJ79708.1 UDP-N-acetylmuramoylalanine--D-glutamate ligase [Hathewaya proteolytica DSM 3090]
MRKNFEEFKKFIKGKNVAVVGVGISNMPLIFFLVELGAKVTAFDKKTADKIDDEFMKRARENHVDLVLGEGYLDKLVGFDVVFKTPVMRIDNAALVKAKEEGAYITSEMEEFVKYCPCKIYGVTGSDGKTTTTTLIYKMLSEQGFKTWVGGNIGKPLFASIEEITAGDRVVVELSSFQLMTMDVSVDIAAITNLSPNHLDMHKDMQEYIDAKKNIFKYQQHDGRLILNRENEITYSMISEGKGSVELFSSKRDIESGAYFKENVLYVKDKAVCKKDDIVIKGMHNVENYLTAFLAVNEEVDIENMKKVAETFAGVEHRGEFVREIKGVKYFNDSIASSPTRTLATMSSFPQPVILIAGGYDKNISYQPLADQGYKYIKSMILLGDTKVKIQEAFMKLKEEKNIEIPTCVVDNMEEAVNKAKAIAENGDYVLLSPASASFDMFPNFEVRGNIFKSIVNNLE